MLMKGSVGIVWLVCMMAAVVSQTQTGNTTEKCPDGIMETIDYGDLSKPGTGRVLEIRGQDFYVNGDKVFLSGANTAWVVKGKDFGNNYHEDRRRTFECYLRRVHGAGGNSMRHVIGLDKQGSLISDLRKYLRAAAHYNIVAVLTLWETTSHHQSMAGVVQNETILQSYIDNALIPLVRALKDEAGLGGYEIIHKFEGLVIEDTVSTEPCFDTRRLHNTGAGWAGESFSMQDLLRFISRQTDAIRSVDPSTPVTAGATSIMFDTDQFGFFNYHKDECLLKAGGRTGGYLTFYSAESRYHHQTGGFPLKQNASDYNLDKPLVIGTFDQKHGHGMTTKDMFQWAYRHWYSGAWSWLANSEEGIGPTDSMATQLLGMESIQFETGYSGRVKFELSKYKFLPHF